MERVLWDVQRKYEKQILQVVDHRNEFTVEGFQEKISSIVNSIVMETKEILIGDVVK